MHSARRQGNRNHFTSISCVRFYIVRKALATKLFQLRLGERHDAAYELLITGALVVVGWPGAVVWGAVVGSRVGMGSCAAILCLLSLAAGNFSDTDAVRFVVYIYKI
jgi:hypothetical protein